MEDEYEHTTFVAAFPAIQSAIKFGGDGGVRIQLDIPDTDAAAAVKLLGWRRMVLMVTVAPVRPGLINTGEQGGADGAEPDDMEERPKRKPKWSTA